MSEEIVMTKITPSEKTRTYTFPNGQRIELNNVTEFCNRASGTHRLRTGDGKLHVIPTGWLHIEIDAMNWTM